MANNQASRAKKKWSERETTKFLELYEGEEVLWNVRLKEYKNKDARNAAVQRLIQNLDFVITADDVNKKINNIRSTYLQEKAKVKKSMGTGSGAEDIYVPTLAWYEIADRFLCDIVKCRKTFRNIDSDSDRDEISSPEVPASPSQNILPEGARERALEEPVLSDTPSQVSPAPAPASPSHDLFVKPLNIKTKKRSNVDRIEKSIQQLQTLKDQVLSNKSDSNKEPEDEFTFFGKNIASQLRQLPIMDALDLESEIMELVKRKRKSFLERESSSASTGDTNYTIEIPEHIWSQNDASYEAVEESQSILIPQTQKRKKERESSSTSTSDTNYTIEIPEHVIHGVLSQNDVLYEVVEESQSILMPQVQTPQVRESALELAIKSIGGVNHLSEE